MARPKTMDANCGDCLLFGAVQGMTDGLVLLDESGRILHLNRTAAELLQLKASGVIGAEIAEAIPESGIAAFWNSAAGEAGAVTGEVPFPSGATVRATISPCLSASGEAMGRVLILRDVTLEKKIQVELSSAVAERLVKMTSKGPTGAPMPDLTRREAQVLELLAAGLTNAQIAKRLNVSANTVASHLKNLYSKLKVASRSQAVAFAMTHGIRLPNR